MVRIGSFAYAIVVVAVTFVVGAFLWTLFNVSAVKVMNVATFSGGSTYAQDGRMYQQQLWLIGTPIAMLVAMLFTIITASRGGA